MTNYAKIETEYAALTTEFGYNMAVKWFGQDAVDALPKYVRGQNAGKPKGFYSWTKVIKGGWVRGLNYVENRVNTIIKRSLHSLETSKYGKTVIGHEIHVLGAGVTLMDQTRQDVEYGNRLMMDEFINTTKDSYMSLALFFQNRHNPVIAEIARPAIKQSIEFIRKSKKW